MIAWLVLPVGLPLGGCADLDSQARQVSNSVSSEIAGLAGRIAPPPPRHTATPHAAHTASAPATTAAPEPAASPPGPPISVDGLSAGAVRDLLGTPASRTTAAPGETWTYRDGGCELRLFLFPDVASGGLRVLDHRIADAAPAAADPQACLRRLHDDHAG